MFPIAPGTEKAISCPGSRFFSNNYVAQLPVLNLSVKVRLVTLSPAANCIALQHHACCNSEFACCFYRDFIYEIICFSRTVTLWRNINNSGGGFKHFLKIIWPSYSGKSTYEKEILQIEAVCLSAKQQLTSVLVV